MLLHELRGMGKILEVLVTFGALLPRNNIQSGVTLLTPRARPYSHLSAYIGKPQSYTPATCLLI